MKKTIALAALAFAAAGAISAQAEPESYTLVCRGSNDTRVMVNHDVDGAGNAGATAMTVFFRGGSNPDNPGAGECVWQDRAMLPGESSAIWMKSPNIKFAFQVTGDGRVARDGSGMRLSVEGAHASTEAKDWQHVLSAVTNGSTIKVKVYAQNGVMVVTQVLRPY